MRSASYVGAGRVQNLNFVGIDSPGSLQERWNVRADWLIRLPDDLPLDVAALAEPTAVAVHDVRRSELRPGDKAVVIDLLISKIVPLSQTRQAFDDLEDS
ncbi:hypothetical protein Q9R08_01515 [Microbacterium sp. QXD-8]|uniref:Uncharacterized protein n=1 Tax=Microbacterium psychrotolerans TaxID=3068321 RepID=A0ABU0YWD7_9MICO|nr:hypothetical protein [Microbacterium sp. QXD-8]MDQ7876643.1 hypothetical protein [Microbacterium sp. QXD-8]